MQGEIFSLRMGGKKTSHSGETSHAHANCPFCHNYEAERIDRDGKVIIFHCPVCEIEFGIESAGSEEME